MQEQESPFACDMSAIAVDQRAEHMATMESLFRAAEEMLELANGYKFRLPNDSENLRKASEFIALERLCCPFFGFTLEVEREGGPLWLSLTGRNGVKPFIIAELGAHVLHGINPVSRSRALAEDEPS